MRIGHGFDVHPLGEGRPFVIGGVTIPFEKGLLGYSDADVLLHALIDALLGAMALGDIGGHFPPGDPAYCEIDSRLLLAKTVDLMKDKGFTLVNADMIIMAERPKMKPYIPSMQRVIAEIIGCNPEDVGIKATTTEKLGFVGREEGIAASAVVLLEKKESDKGGSTK